MIPPSGIHHKSITFRSAFHASNEVLHAFGRHDKHHARRYLKSLTCHAHGFVLPSEASSFTAR